MSALVFQGDRQLTQLTVAAVEAQSALERALVGPFKWEPALLALMTELVHIARLEWWFTVQATPEEVLAARREVLAHRDYVTSALFVAAGAAGDRVEWLLEQTGSPLVAGLHEHRVAASMRLNELNLALRFLLEEEDPTGDIERAFGLPMPKSIQPDGPSVEFDFS